VRQKKDTTDTFWVNLRTGGEHKWRFFAVLKRDGTIHHGKKNPACHHSDLEAVAFRWFINNLMAKSAKLAQVEFWHEGYCGRCGRELTVPESIERGLGPQCARRM
jgi:hypothetical protein